MKVVINPKYAHLSDFVHNVLERNYKATETYRNFRNTVEDVTVGGVHMVVKIFKKPLYFNRIMYTFFRPSKARRSYEFSLKYLEMGFDVPEPVAYIEKRKGLFFHTGCFISVFTDYRPVSDFDVSQVRDARQFEFLKRFCNQLADYTARLHGRGILHGDYNMDNILYKIDLHNDTMPENGSLAGQESSFQNYSGDWQQLIKEEHFDISRVNFRFSLIDLNRGGFGNRSNYKCSKDLGCLHLDIVLLSAIIKKYCARRSIANHIAFELEVLANTNKHKRITHLKDALFTPLGLRKKRPEVYK